MNRARHNSIRKPRETKEEYPLFSRPLTPVLVAPNLRKTSGLSSLILRNSLALHRYPCLRYLDRSAMTPSVISCPNIPLSSLKMETQSFWNKALKLECSMTLGKKCVTPNPSLLPTLSTCHVILLLCVTTFHWLAPTRPSISSSPASTRSTASRWSYCRRSPRRRSRRIMRGRRTRTW
jgi:hypothetical protein